MNGFISGTKQWFNTVMQPFGLMKKNFGNVIAFEVNFRLFTFFVLFPIMTCLERLWLVGNKTSVITWDNLMDIIKNPLTWIVLILLGILLVAGTMFEQFALYDTLHACKCGEKRTLRQIFSAGFDLVAERCRPENWLLLPYAVLVVRFGTLTGDVSSVLSVIKIPGFILEDFHKHNWEKAAFLIFQVIAIYCFLRWIYSIPVMMTEDEKSFKAACKKSAAMTRGKHVIKVGFIALGWLILLCLLYYAGTAVIVGGWFLLSSWLMPGETPDFNSFFAARFTPTGTIFYLLFLWVVTPMIASSFQCAYYKRKEQLGEALKPYTEPPHFISRYPALKWAIVVLCAVTLFFSGPKRFAQIRWMLNTDCGIPMIMAHRGYSAKAPENTLPAFKKCIDEGVTAAELDVQMLADGTIIVMHDDNLKRTTGLDKNVWEVTYDEIKDLDNGSFFSRDFAGTKICTLDEVLKLAGSGDSRLYLNIEIKRNGHDDGITQKVVDIILENGYLKNCDITSQDYKTLEEVRKINPYVLTAYTSVVGLGEMESLDAADIISIQETFATFENVERLHRAGKRVFVWTVNEKETMKDLVSLNVDAILTNDPALCKTVVDQYGSDIMNMVQRVRSAFSFL